MKKILMSLFILAFSLCTSAQVKDNDGKEYKSVKIGEQEWMAENYCPTKFNNGDPIPVAKNAEDWEKRTKNKEPLMCYLNFDEKNKEEYGALYNAYVFEDERGVLPSGWKIPEKSDWEKLGVHLGGNSSASFILEDEKVNVIKSKTGWKSKDEKEMNGTNLSGFDAKPSGWIDVAFRESNMDRASFWSTTTGTKKKYLYYFSISPTYCSIRDGEKWIGQAIRLIKE